MPLLRGPAAGLFLVLAVVGDVHAGEPTGATLKYRVAGGVRGCPAAASLRGEVAVRLGYDPFVAGGHPVVRVDISRSRRGLVGRVRLERRGGAVLGERTVGAAAGRCGELVRALALSVSLVLDAEAATRPGDPRREADLRPVGRRGRRDPEPPAPPPPAPAEPDRPGPAGWLGLGGLGALGAAPDVTGGAWAAVGLGWERATLSVEIRADVPSGTEAGGGRVEAGGVVATVAPCLRFGPARACALAGGGVLLVHGVGLDGEPRRATPFAAVGLRAGAVWRFAERWRLDARLDLRAPLARTSLRVGGEVVWRTPVVDGSLGLGVGWRFR
ncbi:MAG: hypothetical protein ACQEXJ_07745 [Myxococcota bacterium]